MRRDEQGLRIEDDDEIDLDLGNTDEGDALYNRD